MRRKRPALLADEYHVLCMHSNEVSVLVRVGGGGGAAGQRRVGDRPSACTLSRVGWCWCGVWFAPRAV